MAVCKRLWVGHISSIMGCDMQAAVLSVAESDWSDAEQRRRNAFFEGRTGNLQKFKHGVDTIVLMFSDQDASRVFRFPWYDRFRPHVEPILEQVLPGSVCRQADLLTHLPALPISTGAPMQAGAV